MSLIRGTTVTVRSAAAQSSWRSPSASPIRIPVSCSTANSSRSRNRSQASRIACTSATVRILGCLRGTFNPITRRAAGWALLMWCRNGRHDVPRRPAGCQLRQQLAQVDAVPGGVLVERADRRQLPVHRRRAAVRLHRGQHRDPPVPGRRWQPQPGHELADVLQPDLPPVQPAAGEEHEPVLQIMGIRLDRVRRPLDIGQERQVPLDRLDRHPVLDRAPSTTLRREPGITTCCNEHRTSRDPRAGPREITTSTRQNPGPHLLVDDVADTPSSGSR